MVRPLHLVLPLVAALVLSSVPAVRAATVAPPGAAACEPCLAVPDTCCDERPTFPGTEAPTFSSNVVVVTREPYTSYPYSVSILDLGSPLPSPLEDENWATILRYNGPFNSWNADSLGTVFGLTLDKYGNIFVTHTSCYTVDSLSNVLNGGPGAVYRIDAITGKVTTFCRLPNYPDPAKSPGEWWPGLGNISYDCRHEQFFVTNEEDGRIYRIKAVGVNGPTGTIVEVFDPLTADTGPTNYLTPVGLVPSPGWAPLGERLWGVQVHNNRVFYSVWVEDASAPNAGAANEIRSVGLDAVGAFVGGSDQHELDVPGLLTYNWSMPVSDISFSASGKMLLGERGVSNDTWPWPHAARVLEYQCSGGCWLPANTYDVGFSFPENSEGGVDYDRHTYTGLATGRVWASGDHLHVGFPYPDIIYGYQGFRPTGGTIANSMLIDSDANLTFGEKTSPGDIEAPGCPNLAVGTICGRKYHDLNHNGTRDGGEPVLAGWTIVLTGPGGPYTATTDGNGYYCFNDLPPGNYTASEAGQPGWVQTAPPGGSWAITLAGGQAIVGKDFGNYGCTSFGNCVNPPPGMVAWWPFNETAGSTSAADVLHLVPSKNVALPSGGAAIATGGQVGNRLCASTELDYARVPIANQLGLDFGAGPFSIDAWIQMTPGGGGPRLIAEKRVLVSSFPYKTRGWALYLNGLQLQLEIGNGIATQVYAGPTVAASTWQHVAVTVDRAAFAGRWYLNGVVVPAYNFNPLPGAVGAAVDVYMGRVSPPFGFGASFEGCIDELELFNTVLPAASVQAIYSAGSAGKCPEFIRLPQVTTICKNATSVTVCFNICNNTATPQSYHWSLAGLPAGPGCTVAGPTSFSPSAGTVTVAPGTCSPSICVTIPRPAGLTAQNATSCFRLTMVNDATGECRSADGTIRADNTCWCVTPPTGIIGVPARMPVGIIGIPVDIGVGHPCDPIARLDYQVSAVFEPGDHGDPLAVSLNGLPPGEPVIGWLELDTGGSGTISVAVAYPGGYNPGARYSLLLQADTDGDGLMEPLCTVPIASEVDPDDVTAVPGEPKLEDAIRLVASPNPFHGGSSIAFTLATPDEVQLGIYDISGRLVRSLNRGRLQAGAHRIEWDGRDSRGVETSGGIYFVKLRSERLKLETKLVKIR